MLLETTGLTESLLLNDDYYAALIEDISCAQKTIDLATYIFRQDSIGNTLIDALAAAAQRGVRVRVLVDGIGTGIWDFSLISRLNNLGIQGRIFHPFPTHVWQWGQAAHVPQKWLLRALFILTRINTRHHRKICIIDHEVVYVSSANIEDSHLSKAAGGKGWRDTTIRLTGVKTGYLQFAFETAWQSLPLHKRLLGLFPRRYIDPVFNLNMTRWHRRKIYHGLLIRIRHAKEHIWIENPYFLPDNRLLRALNKAAERKVDVRIILSQHCDVFISGIVANTFYRSLLKHGVKIYEYLPSVLHSKILIVDNWCSVGSSNLNSRSFKHDLEADVKVRTRSVKIALQNHFHTDIGLSTRIEINDLKKQSWLKKFLGRILLFVRNFL